MLQMEGNKRDYAVVKAQSRDENKLRIRFFIAQV